MATSFHVNAHDLGFILKQIEVSELEAGGMTTVQAIMQVYGVSAADAALMPVGLRTVDGTDNNLLPGRQDVGSAQTEFPRLTDPTYVTDAKGSIDFDGPGPARPIVNGNYTPNPAGTGMDVVDTAPRVISNLLVDQTPANPAAVYAALKAVGITGTQANNAVGQITSAYRGTLNANGANAEVTRTQAALAAEQTQFNVALDADIAADATVAHYAEARGLATTAGARAGTAQAAADALDGGLTDANYAAALAAAEAALAAASAVVKAIEGDVTQAALQTQEGAETLYESLLALNEGGINANDAAGASAAANAYRSTSSGAAQASDDAIAARLASAQTAAANTQAALNTATTELGTAQAAFDAAKAAAGTAGTPAAAAEALADALAAYNIETGPEGGLVIENISPDVGLTPSFNSFMTIFGQFFDHGLDLVNKGGNGTVYIPLEADDPLIAGADKVFGTPDDLPASQRFMVMTRATQTFVNGVAQHTNATTSYVDQNQTYTSHASHQAFLREYSRVSVGGVVEARATGALLDGTSATGSLNGSIATWADVKAQALAKLGIRLEDSDVGRVPLLATDAYGNLDLGRNGYAQMVMTNGTLQEGSAAGITTAGSRAAGPAFLVDIAHNAVPGTKFDHDNNPATPTVTVQADADSASGNVILTDNRGNKVAYDDELLNKHIVSGDGRGNENIALQSMHSIFHSEHNRILEENKHTILETRDLAFINEWLLVDLTSLDNLNPASLVWDGDRMFQAARFTTEMQYQHMVFEEFARRVSPGVDPFVFTNTADVDASILAEFAHTVYRFGHSMLTDTVDRLDANLNPVNGDAKQMSLIEAFLNPQAFTDSGNSMDEVQAAFIRGLTSDVGNEIDEFIVPALQSSLLGLPLDLAALNIARGRDTGVPSLNDTRAQLYNDFALPDLKPYTSWSNFAQSLKNPMSLINFVAAYGNHSTLTAASVDTLAEKRAAATLLVLGGTNAPGDRLDFLNGRGVYGASNDRGGLDNVDLWIGGLAEKVQEFGGMLGSTFGFLFEYQMESLQNGDRFYYLSRTQGLNLLDGLESNSFTDIVMRNSALGGDHATHISGNLFLTPDMILELDSGIAQRDYNGNAAGRDPTWDDDILQGFSPKVERVNGSTGADGHQRGGELHFQGGEHVVLGGTEGNDILTSDLGDDTLWGDGGDDYLNGAGGADQVFGGNGDDIIEDLLGANFLRGERGDDVISSSRGFTLSFGGEGQDAVLLGQDFGEAFGGGGNDFMLGGAGADTILGNEGDDWIEGGEGFDGIAGDNSELFFNSTIIGHDVAWGQGNDQDYDLESGDDIALSGIGIQRFEGMFGFDWASAKYDIAGVNWDFGTPIFTTDPADILRDRFDLMEAMSGWKHNDTMVGDNRGGTIDDVDPILDFDDHLLTQAGINRIEGLNAWFAGARATLFGAGATTYRNGNIIMGGDGADRMEGRGGFDLIDGDAWLNVRIKIMVGGTEYSAESLNSAQNTAGALSGKVFNVDGNGNPNFASPAFGGRSLTSLLLDRTIDPGDMSIVREILTDTTPGDIDTATFTGNLDDYLIEGRGTRSGNIINSARDVNGDGFISVIDQGGAGRPNQLDDTDLIKGIELLDFADQTIDIKNPLGIVVDLGFEPALRPGAIPAANTVLGQVTSEGVVGTFALAAGSSAALAVNAAGELRTTATTLGVNQTHVLNLAFTASGFTSSERITLRTGSTAVNTITGNTGDDIVYADAGNDTVNGDAGDDVLFGQAGFDTLNGGDGRDLLIGGINGDNVNGGAGDDRIQFVVGEGDDAVNGGDGFDILEVRGAAATDSLTVTWNGTRATTMSGFTGITNVEEIRVDLLGGTNLLAYNPNTSTAGVSVDLEAGQASGLASIANVSNVNGTNLADWIRGNGQANSLNGFVGADTLVATVDTVRDVLFGGSGIDVADFSAYQTGLVTTLSTTAASTVLGTGGTDLASDTVNQIENLIGGGGNDQFSGTGDANRLWGGAGNDVLRGAGGNDTLLGDGGDDQLNGGAGQDTLTGGIGGEDRFIFSAVGDTATAATQDSVLDFEGAGGPGGDLIDVSAIPGNFTFIVATTFGANATNQLRVTTIGNDTFVLLDTDSDTGAEAQIRIAGVHNLAAEDFIL